MMHGPTLPHNDFKRLPARVLSNPKSIAYTPLDNYIDTYGMLPKPFPGCLDSACAFTNQSTLRTRKREREEEMRAKQDHSVLVMRDLYRRGALH